MYKALYWLFAFFGRPFGGIRPRRIQNWLARRAYDEAPSTSDFKWYRDRFGFELLLHPHYQIDHSIIAFGIFDPSIVKYIDKNIQAGMVCLDVGANIGLMSLHLAKRTEPEGAVHCFEPVPHLFTRLNQNIERNRLQSIIRLHQVALSNKIGTISMAIAASATPNQGLGSIVVPCGTGLLVEPIKVWTTTLDDFASRERLTRLDFVKIDIQGAEPLFFEGGANTLAQFRPTILMEIAPLELAAIGRSGQDLLAQVENLGYEVFLINENGETTERLRARDVPPNYHNAGVLCRPRD